MSGIFGNAVGTTAPRANLLQEDSTKPDFVKGKEIIDNKIREALEEAGAGVAGKDGTTFTPSVDAEGNLSWTNNGGLSNPDTVNIMGADGYTPVKGTDYYTAAEKDEMEEAVLEHFGMPAEVEFSKAGNTVGVYITEEDGSSIHQTIMLDANGIPKSVTQYGVTCNLVWEGFE